MHIQRQSAKANRFKFDLEFYKMEGPILYSLQWQCDLKMRK